MVSSAGASPSPSSAAASGASSPSASSSPSSSSLFLGLGLDDLRRHRDGRDDRFLGVVEERDTLLGGDVGETERVTHLQRGDVDLDSLRDLERKRFDVDLARDLRQHATFDRPGGLADELDHDLRLNRLVQPHFLKIDVGKPARDDVGLVVLEDRGMRRLLSLEDDVEDRVQPAGAGQRLAQLALADGEGMRFLPAAVENSRDHPLPAEPPRGGRADLLALLDLDLDSFTCHGAAV